MSERETQEALKLYSEKSAQYVAERAINRELVAALKAAQAELNWIGGVRCNGAVLDQIQAALKLAGTP